MEYPYGKAARVDYVLIAASHTDEVVTPDGKFTTDEALSKIVRQVFPMSPHGIINQLKLRRPVYCPTAAYGHFGRKEFAWEQVDATEELKAKVKGASR